MNRITETAHERVCDISELNRALCWLQTPMIAPERAHYRRSMVPRKHVPPSCWRFVGLLSDPRIDPTTWLMRGRPTLKTKPLEHTFACMTNRDVYAALLSRLFDQEGSECAFSDLKHLRGTKLGKYLPHQTRASGEKLPLETDNNRRCAAVWLS